jgi:hypothetical protein
VAAAQQLSIASKLMRASDQELNDIRNNFERTRKKGSYSLTDAEITSCQEIVRAELRKYPKLARRKGDDLAEHFRPLFKLKRKVSNRTLRRHIIEPVIKP